MSFKPESAKLVTKLSYFHNLHTLPINGLV